MIKQRTAVLIPFPRPPARQADGSMERLRRALLVLDAALTEQRNAVSQWQGALGELRGSVGGLGTTLCSYQNALSALDGKVEALKTHSERLAAWSDDIPRSAATTPE